MDSMFAILGHEIYLCGMSKSTVVTLMVQNTWKNTFITVFLILPAQLRRAINVFMCDASASRRKPLTAPSYAVRKNLILTL